MDDMKKATSYLPKIQKLNPRVHLEAVEMPFGEIDSQLIERFDAICISVDIQSAVFLLHLSPWSHVVVKDR